MLRTLEGAENRQPPPNQPNGKMAHVGERVSVDGSRGTVRYVGPVATSKTAGAVYAGAYHHFAAQDASPNSFTFALLTHLETPSRRH